MKKIALGVVVGLGLALGGSALAAISVVDANSSANIERYYDSDTNVICYTLKIGTFGEHLFQSSMSGSVGISCLKNI